MTCAAAATALATRPPYGLQWQLGAAQKQPMHAGNACRQCVQCRHPNPANSAGTAAAAAPCLLALLQRCLDDNLLCLALAPLEHLGILPRRLLCRSQRSLALSQRLRLRVRGGGRRQQEGRQEGWSRLGRRQALPGPLLSGSLPSHTHALTCTHIHTLDTKKTHTLSHSTPQTPHEHTAPDTLSIHHPPLVPSWARMRVSA